VGVALEHVVETSLLADSRTTCTPNTIEEVGTVPETWFVEEGTEASVPEGATEAFEPTEEAVEAETELKLEDVACTAGEPVARDPGVELSIAVVVVARTELPVVFASAGVSITSGLAATKTKATFWAPCVLPSALSEGAMWEKSAVRTEKLLVETRSTSEVESE
jgi:hypothetical protein